jgi:cobalt-zinc-cadmium resistance protein CzcA
MMIDALLEFSMRQRAFVLMASAALLATGLWSATRLPIDAVPDITNVQVQINTEVKGLAPEEIEQQVTYPIEMEMSGIQGLTELRSLSKFGLSQVNLIFEDGTDLYRARQLASERLQNALEKLPSSASPKLAPISTGLGEIYYYVVEYRKGYEGPGKPQDRHAQLMELKLIHDFIIKPQLRSVPGVAEVNTSGGYEKQIVVLPRPEKLASLDLTFSEVAKILAENVENAGGGLIQVGGEQVSIRANGRVQSAEDIARLPLKFRAGTAPVLLGDVAEVAIGANVRTGASTYNGEECVLGATLMLTGENSRIVAKRVADKIREIGPSLPEGVEIITVYNRMNLVERTIRTVEKNLFEGAIFVVVVLLLLLGNWRAALIVSSAIPLSFLFAITGMVQNRISGNLMSLGAIDFGLIIDGAVVMVENIIRHLAHKQRQMGRLLTAKERAHEVLVSAKEVGGPMFFGVLIVTVVYIPILALTGIEGRMFKPMALTVMFALGGALVLALTLMPVLCSYLLNAKIEEQDSRLVTFFKNMYRPLLEAAFRRRWTFVAAAAALFVFSLLLLSRMGKEFIPQLDEGSFATHMIRTTSIGLDKSVEMQRQSDKVLLERFPEVTYTFSRIGTAEVATDPMGANVADSYIFYKPESEWTRAKTKDGLADQMSRELSVQVPGQAYLFSQPIEMRFNEILEGTRSDIAVKVFGDDHAEIERIAMELRGILEKIPGAADVEFDAIGKAPLLEIRPNREAMARYNIHAAEINAAVATALAGEETGQVIDGNRRYPVVVRLPEDLRNRMDMMKAIPVRTSDGGLVSLGQAADFEVIEKVNAINRELGQRRAAIMVNLRGRDVAGWVEEAREKIKPVRLPPGYRVEFGGQFKNYVEASRRLMVVVPAALALIFILLFFSFGSLRQAALVFLCVPLAVTGGIFALALRGMPFTISAAVGFIALSGIAVLNGVMLIAFINQLREQGQSLREAVLEGTLTRLRPKLMTALVAALGFVPMAMAGGAGAEVQRPLATVVIGGIVTSTFLTLVLLPILYDWMENRIEPEPQRNPPL